MASIRKEKNQPIQVFVRVRPPTKDEDNSNIVDIRGSKELSIKHHSTTRNYTFDRVFGPDSKQMNVYKLVAEPTVAEVIAGYNCTVLAYGQTGTGKTYTMVGANASEAYSGSKISWCEDLHCGIIPRTLSHLFDELRLQHLDYTVRVSYLELYNEEIFDLLSPVDDSSKLKLYDDTMKKGSVIVQGLTECTVSCKSEVYKILEKGAEKRRIASTLMNAQSSRSHTVFCITVHTKESSVDGEDLLKTGKLYLVDLAGSENIKQSGATDIRAREAFSINQSLLTLGRCIVKLIERSVHIPYRESKLTRLLQDSLGGRTKTTLIATVSPAFCNADETINTLDYASRAKCITNKPEINQRLSKNALLKEYTMEIERLKKDLLAARMGKGIYLDKDNYDTLLKELDNQREEIVQKIGTITAHQEEMARLETTCSHLKMSLTQHEEDVQLKTEAISTLESKLEEASKTITGLNEENELKEFIVETHSKTEKILQETTKTLINVANISTTDAEKLHNKLDTLIALNKQNLVTCEERVNEISCKINHMQTCLREFRVSENKVGKHLLELLHYFEQRQEEYKHVQSDYMKDICNSLQMYLTFCNTDSDKVTRLTENLGQAQNEISVSAEEKRNNLNEKYQSEIVPVMSKLSEYLQLQQDLTVHAVTAFKITIEENNKTTSSLTKMVKDVLDNTKELLLENLKQQTQTHTETKEKLYDYFACQKVFQQAYEEKLDNALTALEEAKSLSVRQFEHNNMLHMSHLNLVNEAYKSVLNNSSQVDTMTEKITEIFDNFNYVLEGSTKQKFAKYHLLKDQNYEISEATDSCAANANKNIKVFSDQVSEVTYNMQDTCCMHFEKQQAELRGILAERSENLRSLEENMNSINDKMETSSLVIFDQMKSKVTDMSKLLEQNFVVCSQHESHMSTELDKCKENFKKLFHMDIKEYQKTGVTPMRRRYNYPTTVVETVPREQLVDLYKRHRSSSTSRLSPTKLHKLIRTTSESNIQNEETYENKEYNQ